MISLLLGACGNIMTKCGNCNERNSIDCDIINVEKHRSHGREIVSTISNLSCSNDGLERYDLRRKMSIQSSIKSEPPPLRSTTSVTISVAR